mgnify:CR=1 FL=1
MWQPLLHLMKEWRRRGSGVAAPENKEVTAGRAVRRLPFAPELTVLLAQHTGAPSAPSVHEGQEVVRGEPIAEPGGFVSVPQHAPATGVVSRIGLAMAASGKMAGAIRMRVYPASSQEVLYGAPRELDMLSREELVAAVRDAGLVGLGGAAFPTHVKLSIPKGKQADTVLANGCECEPYLTTDHRVMVERSAEVVAGLRLAMRAVGASRAVIAIEDNKPDAIAAFQQAIQPDESVQVATLNTRYPQGAEKVLIKAVLDRDVPPRGLPVDVGAVVLNVGTLAQMAELLPMRRGLIERVITVAGDGVERPGNYLVPLGTPLRFLLGHAGFQGTARQVVLGGPMMGAAVASLDVPITKGTTGVLALTEEQVAAPRPVRPCIRCGACVEVCPMRLNPSELGLLARKRRYTLMEEQYHLNDCFECGCCSYVCPSNIPLVQLFRVAKSMNREAAAREQTAAKEETA